MTNNNYMVSIIIPVYNQWNFTDKCLKSIKKNTVGIELDLMYKNGFNVEGFIDSNPAKHGETVKSITVYSPDVLKSNCENRPFIVIGSMYRKEIEAQLKTLGFDIEQDCCPSQLL